MESNTQIQIFYIPFAKSRKLKSLTIYKSLTIIGMTFVIASRGSFSFGKTKFFKANLKLMSKKFIKNCLQSLEGGVFQRK